MQIFVVVVWICLGSPDTGSAYTQTCTDAHTLLDRLVSFSRSLNSQIRLCHRLFGDSHKGHHNESFVKLICVSIVPVALCTEHRPVNGLFVRLIKM